MKKLLFLFLVTTLLLSCGEEGGLKGRLTLSITDGPTDDINVKGVNLVFLNVEMRRNGEWKSLKSFDQPIGVNLLEYTGGSSLLLIDQYVDPGEISAFRFTLNVANPNESVIRSPQSNITYANGSSKPLYLADTDNHQVVIEEQLGIETTGITDITLDFDVRKSISLNGENQFVMNPFVRVLETKSTGHIAALVSNATGRVVAFAYKKGTFNGNESTPTDGISYRNAISSCSVKGGKFGLGFLEPGEYDLFFVSLGEAGQYQDILGSFRSVTVHSGEQKSVEIDLAALSPA